MTEEERTRVIETERMLWAAIAALNTTGEALGMESEIFLNMFGAASAVHVHFEVGDHSYEGADGIQMFHGALLVLLCRLQKEGEP